MHPLRSIASLLLLPTALYAQAPAAPARQLGTVKSIDGSSVTLTTAAGAAITFTVSAETPVLQLPVGSTNLKEATPSTLASIAVGDRILVTISPVTTKPGETTASRIILMRSSDIAARNNAQQADWQKRGNGGLVRTVDGSTLTVAAGARALNVVTTPTTIFRRYANDSVKFENAKLGTLAQIHPGDQLRARGATSDDRASLTAEEVISGTFANLSGAITAVDATAGTITLKDLTTKKSVTISVTSNSDLRKLPPQAAAAFAARNSGGAAGPAAGANPRTPGVNIPPPSAPRPAGSPPPATETAARPQGGRPGAATEGEGRPRNAGQDLSQNLSQMLSRLPQQTLADLHPGDAVLIVASEAGSASYTAITLLSGVEQLLSATGSGGQPITLSPWNLGTPGEGGGGQ